MTTAALAAGQLSDVSHPSHDDIACVDDNNVSNDYRCAEVSRKTFTEGLVMSEDGPELSPIESLRHAEESISIAIEYPVGTDNNTVSSDDSSSECSRKIITEGLEVSDDGSELSPIEYPELISRVQDQNLAVEQPGAPDNNTVSNYDSCSEGDKKIISEGLAVSEDGPELSQIESPDHMEWTSRNLAVEYPPFLDNNSVSRDSSSECSRKVITEGPAVSDDGSELSPTEYPELISRVQDQNLAVGQRGALDSNNVSSNDSCSEGDRKIISEGLAVSEDGPELSPTEYPELISRVQDQNLVVEQENNIAVSNDDSCTEVSRKIITEGLAVSDDGPELSQIESPDHTQWTSRNFAVEYPLVPDSNSVSRNSSSECSRNVIAEGLLMSDDGSELSPIESAELISRVHNIAVEQGDYVNVSNDDSCSEVSRKTSADRLAVSDDGQELSPTECPQLVRRRAVDQNLAVEHPLGPAAGSPSDVGGGEDNNARGDGAASGGVTRVIPVTTVQRTVNTTADRSVVTSSTRGQTDTSTKDPSDDGGGQCRQQTTDSDDLFVMVNLRITSDRYDGSGALASETREAVSRMIVRPGDVLPCRRSDDFSDVCSTENRQFYLVRKKRTNVILSGEDLAAAAVGDGRASDLGPRYSVRDTEASDRIRQLAERSATRTTSTVVTKHVIVTRTETTASDDDHVNRQRPRDVRSDISDGRGTTAAEYDETRRTEWTKEIRRGSSFETDDGGSCGATDAEENGTTSTGYMSVSETYSREDVGVDSLSSSGLEEETETVTDVMDVMDATLVMSDDDDDDVVEPTGVSEADLDRIAPDSGDREFVVELTENVTMYDDSSDDDLRRMAAEGGDSRERDKTEVDRRVVNVCLSVELEETDMRHEVREEMEPSVDVLSTSPLTSDSECVDSAVKTSVVESYAQISTDEGVEEDAKLSDISEIETCVIAPDVIVSEVRTPGAVVINKGIPVLEDKGVHVRDDEAGDTVADAGSVINEYAESSKDLTLQEIEETQGVVFETMSDTDDDSNGTVGKPSRDSSIRYEREVIKTETTKISKHTAVERTNLWSTGVQTDQTDSVRLSTTETQTLDETFRNAGDVITADAGTLTAVDVSVVETQTLPYKDSISTAEAQTSTVTPHLVNIETETEEYKDERLMSEAETSTTSVDTAVVETQTLPYCKEDVSTSEAQTSTVPDDLVMTDSTTGECKAVDVVMVDADTNTTPVPPTVVVETQTSRDSFATAEAQTFTAEPDLVHRQTETDQTLTADAETGGTTPIDYNQVEETTQTLPCETDVSTADMETSTISVELISADTQTLEDRADTLMIEAETSTTPVSTVVVETQTLLDTNDIATAEAETSTVSVDLTSTDTQTSDYKADVVTVEAESQASRADVVDAVTETEEECTDKTRMVEAQTSTSPIDTEAVETQTSAFKEDILTAEVATSTTISVDFSCADTQTIDDNVDTVSTEAQTYTTAVSAVVAETQTLLDDEDNITTAEAHTSTVAVDVTSADTQTDHESDILTVAAETNTSPACTVTAETQTLLDRDNISTADTETWTESVDLVDNETETDKTTLTEAETCTSSIVTSVVETQTLPCKEDLSTTDMETSTMSVELISIDTQTLEDTLMIEAETSTTPVSTIVQETQTVLDRDRVSTADTETWTDLVDLVDTESETDRTLVTEAGTSTLAIDTVVVETQTLSCKEDIATADAETSTVAVDLSSVDTQTIEGRADTLLVEAETSTSPVLTDVAETQTSQERDSMSTAEAQTSTVPVDHLSVDTQTLESKVGVVTVTAGTCTTAASTFAVETQTTPSEESFSTAATQTFTAEPHLVEAETETDRTTMSEAETSTAAVVTAVVQTQTLAYKDSIPTADVETSTVSVELISADAQTVEQKTDTLMTEAETNTAPVLTQVAETQLSLDGDKISTAEAQTSTVAADLVSTDTQTAEYESDILMVAAETNTSPACAVTAETQTLLDRDNISTADTETWTESVDLVDSETETDKTLVTEVGTGTVVIDTTVVETQTLPCKDDVSTTDMETSTMSVELISIDTQTTEDRVDTLITDAETSTTPVSTVVAETQTVLDRDRVSSDEFHYQTSKAETDIVHVGTVTDQTSMAEAETCTTPEATATIETQTHEDISTADTETSTVLIDLISVDTQTTEYGANVVMVVAETSTTPVSTNAVETQTAVDKESISAAAETQTSTPAEPDLVDVETETEEYKDERSMSEAETSTTSVDTAAVETQTLPYCKEDVSTSEAQTSTVPDDLVMTDHRTGEYKAVDVVMVDADTNTTPVPPTVVVETQTAFDNVATSDTETSTVSGVDLVSSDTQTTEGYSKDDLLTAQTQTVESKGDTMEAETCTTRVDFAAVEIQTSVEENGIDVTATTEAETNTTPADQVMVYTQTDWTDVVVESVNQPVDVDDNVWHLTTPSIDPTPVHESKYNTSCDVEHFDDAPVPDSDGEVDADDDEQSLPWSDSEYADALSDDEDNVYLPERDLYSAVESSADVGTEHSRGTSPVVHVWDPGHVPTLCPPDSVPGVMEEQQPVGQDDAGLDVVRRSSLPDSASQEQHVRLRISCWSMRCCVGGGWRTFACFVAASVQFFRLVVVSSQHCMQHGELLCSQDSDTRTHTHGFHWVNPPTKPTKKPTPKPPQT